MRISDWSSDCALPIYSGTVSAAREVAISGIRSIALSQVYAREGMGDAVPFAAARALGERVLRPLIAMPASPRMLFNVNFPAVDAEAVKGIRVVRQGFHDVDRTKIIHGTDPRGYDYYWFGLGKSDAEIGRASCRERVCQYV